MLGYHTLKRSWHLFKTVWPKRIESWAKARAFTDQPRYILLEFPKCGRTWLRYMIRQAEAHRYGIPLQNTMLGVWYPRHALPRVAFTHGFRPDRLLSESHFTISPATPRRKGIIFLVRDPARVMVSYYHHMVYRERVFTGTIGDFIRHPHYGIAKFVEFVDFYYPRVLEAPHLIIRYEDLRADTHGVMGKVLEFCELDMDPDALDRIVANSSFEKMKALEAHGPFRGLRRTSADSRSAKLRSGGADNLDELFSSDDLAHLKAAVTASPGLTSLGYG